ncbi:hypothetical protein B0H17DRAFT_1027454 [Mycena rosella]|uniref:Uncharacterized protein n=1 Tax=Mycena rosella TaxID=1033263 RepID=A0AAD7H2A0_MYCRO|nr:hypothetical protein B0H17DRAFT_1027454 [Mycena rosella]
MRLGRENISSVDTLYPPPRAAAARAAASNSAGPAPHTRPAYARDIDGAYWALIPPSATGAQPPCCGCVWRARAPHPHTRIAAPRARRRQRRRLVGGQLHRIRDASDDSLKSGAPDDTPACPPAYSCDCTARASRALTARMRRVLGGRDGGLQRSYIRDASDDGLKHDSSDDTPSALKSRTVCWYLVSGTWCTDSTPFVGRSVPRSKIPPFWRWCSSGDAAQRPDALPRAWISSCGRATAIEAPAGLGPHAAGLRYDDLEAGLRAAMPPPPADRRSRRPPGTAVVRLESRAALHDELSSRQLRVPAATPPLAQQIDDIGGGAPRIIDGCDDLEYCDGAESRRARIEDLAVVAAVIRRVSPRARLRCSATQCACVCGCPYPHPHTRPAY